LNRDESRLTRAESTLLDGHFVIEHKVRHDSGVFFNFNGTAGIWRREAIMAAGGWQHDTLTEDLDLSYRAQLRGWKFEYVPLVVAPAEVPSDIAAFKSQQHRWAKGSVQVFKKLAVPIWRSHEPLETKLEAMAHLTGNVGYPFVLLLSLLLPLSLGLRNEFSGWVHVALFLVCTLTVLAFYEKSQRVLGRTIGQRLLDTACAVALGIGMSVSQTRAVVEGLLPGTGVFVRTPKKGSGPRRKRYTNVTRGSGGGSSKRPRTSCGVRCRSSVSSSRATPGSARSPPPMRCVRCSPRASRCPRPKYRAARADSPCSVGQRFAPCASPQRSWRHRGRAQESFSPLRPSADSNRRPAPE
jgi:hypothetical protein